MNPHDHPHAPPHDRPPDARREPLARLDRADLGLPHPAPLSAYLGVYAALLILLVVTVAAAFVHLGPITIVVAMAIAAIKAVLVALVFMHVHGSSPLTKLFSIAGLAWLVILFALTFSDYISRGWLPISRGWTDRPILPPPPGVPRPPRDQPQAPPQQPQEPAP